MLCVLAIIGLLAAVALPSYSAHVRSSVMREGALSLMGLSLLQERFRLSTGRYRDSATLIDHRPLPPRVARHYDLQVQLTDSARGFRLLLQPRVPKSDYEPMGLDNTGKKWPLHRWP